MKYRISMEAACVGPSAEDWPKEGSFMLSGNDTIATGGTEADRVFTYMLDNHPGVASAILNCAGKPTTIRLYLDLADLNGLRGTVQPMPLQFYQCGQIELSPND
jgi:hypothetical protein